jgi:hypothetical protein
LLTATASKSTQVDTSLCSLCDQPKQITITDPAHPLFRHEFVLVRVRGSVMNGYAEVVHHGDITLRVPVRATSLCPASPCPPTSKLSLQAIRDLLCLTGRGEPAISPALGEAPVAHHVGDDAEAASRSLPRTTAGEP